MTKTNYFKVSAVFLAAVLATGLLALAGTPREAGAVFPGKNGKIAFSSNRDGTYEVYVANADGSGTPTNVSKSGVYAFEPSFSPNGKKIAFTSYGDGNYEIYVANADGSGTPINVTKSATYETEPSFSPDGKRVVFERGEYYNNKIINRDIVVANADGSGNETGVGSWGDDYSPSFSPDGTKVVFENNGYDREILVANADGSCCITNVSNNAGYDVDPSFSPDGKKIVFESERNNSIDEIFVTNADGSSTPTRVVYSTGTPYSEPSFSPDGKKIAFSSFWDGNHEIYVVNADGSGTPTNVSNNAKNDELFSFSPDGKKIAFESERDGNPEVYVANADGSGTPTNVSNNASYDGGRPDWGSLDDVAPTVASVTPTSGQTDVARNASPTAIFSERMDPETLTTSTVTLQQKSWYRYQVKKRVRGKIRRVWRWTYTWVPVSASVSCDDAAACKTATLDPDSDLLANTDYTVTVTSGAKDGAGNALAQNYSWTFTTGSSATEPSPTIPDRG